MRQRIRMRRLVTAAAAALAVSMSATEAADAEAASPAAGGTGVVVNPGFALDGVGTATPTGWTSGGTASASFSEATGYGYCG